MALDARKMLLAAAQAAIDEAKASPQARPRKRRRLPAAGAVLIGAGLVTAGRLAAGGRGREMLASLQERIEEYEERLSADGAESDEADS